MPLPATVVISCAGMATRLGMGMTKALVDVLGRPLVHWHLAMLRDVEDVRVVVGYQAGDVVNCVRAVRRDALFVFNHAFATTGTAKSLCLGAVAADGDVISLDGDLLVHPADMQDFLKARQPLIGHVPITSSQPVLVDLEPSGDGDRVTAFSTERGDAEWSGLARIPAAELHRADAEGRAERHVYEVLRALLPIAAVPVRAAEIDTPEDYERALEWMRVHRDAWGG